LNQIDLAKGYLKEADLRIETAETVINKKGYAYCVRQCQEVVELALKGALRLLGIDFPKWHDIGNILIKEKEKFPEWFKKEIPDLASYSTYLADLREFTMYGNEIKKKAPSEIFNISNAENALKDAKKCLINVKKLFRQI